MTVTDWIQAVSMVILVVVTGIYAWRTHVISKANKKQADASVEMAEEMREQRVMASRPVIIQKAVPETMNNVTLDYFSHFEVYNAGNGPAVELEISLLNKEKSQISAHRETFLRAGESQIPQICPNPIRPAMPFDLANLDESNYYIVCEYQGILSHFSKQTWYQTWLPFEQIKAGKEGNIYVKPGELEFREVAEKDRIDAFGSRSKPK